MKHSLEGIKILDFTRLLPGPFGTQVLGDLGASIIKVEDQGMGDHTRIIPPAHKQMGAFFCAVNRNKRSLRLDLKKPAGLAVVHRLVQTCGYDVVIEGFRPGVPQRLGIDYQSLQGICPHLIHASLPGFGDRSEKREFGAHDMNLLGMAGVLSVSGNPQTGPYIYGIQVDDLATGLYMAIGVLAALYHRRQTGEGQRVEASMADTALALNATNLLSAAILQKAAGFAEHPLTGQIISYNIYKTRDGRYLSVGAVEPKFWINACNALGLPDLITAQMSCADDGEPAYEKLKTRVAERTLAQWIEVFKDVDACVEPVLDCLEALDHPHFHQRGMIQKIDHPTEGEMVQIGLPVVMSKTPPDIRHPPPTPGEHTDEVLAEAGFSSDEIQALRTKGVVG